MGLPNQALQLTAGVRGVQRLVGAGRRGTVARARGVRRSGQVAHGRRQLSADPLGSTKRKRLSVLSPRLFHPLLYALSVGS